MDELIIICGSTALTLTLNEAGEMLLLKLMMPVHEVKTVELTLGDEEAAESQWVHRAHARFAEPYSYFYGS